MSKFRFCVSDDAAASFGLTGLTKNMDPRITVVLIRHVSISVQWRKDREIQQFAENSNTDRKTLPHEQVTNAVFSILRRIKRRN